MSSTLFDSEVYGGAWASAAMKSLFEEKNKISAWLTILRELARTQAECGLISAAQALEIERVSIIENIDFDFLREEYLRSGHSLHGLFLCLQKAAAPGLKDVFVGATVQDITDTWTVLVLKRAWTLLYSDLLDLEAALLNLAVAHKYAPMAGRTHGQAGAPISFGFKCAVWAAETRRHITRFNELLPRMNCGQLCGAVGAAAGFGNKGLQLQKEFLAALNLNAPGISWTSSRDVLAEFANAISLASSTHAKIGNEIYNLQRTEIAEVSEGNLDGKIGSITMPQKRNPEIAEHLGTLSRAIRTRTAGLNEALIHEHERDGAAWKYEWLEIPEILMLASSCFSKASTLANKLIVYPENMLKNLNSSGGYIFAEALLNVLTVKIGVRARDKVYEVCASGKKAGLGLRQAIQSDAEIKNIFTEEELDSLFQLSGRLIQCTEMVDQVVGAARSARESDERLLGKVQASCKF